MSHLTEAKDKPMDFDRLQLGIGRHCLRYGVQKYIILHVKITFLQACHTNILLL